MVTEVSTIFSGAGINFTTVIGALPVVIGAIARVPGCLIDFSKKAHKAKSAKMMWLHDALRDLVRVALQHLGK